MAQKEQIDQDALAAEWGLALEAEAGAPQPNGEASAGAGSEEAAAAQWAAMVDDGNT